MLCEQAYNSMVNVINLWRACATRVTALGHGVCPSVTETVALPSVQEEAKASADRL